MISERLAADGIVADVRVSDVYALEGVERHAALDAVVAEGAGFPMVIVGGTVACHDGIDLDAVVGAVTRLVTSRAEQSRPAKPVADESELPYESAPARESGCCGGGCC